MSSLPHYGPCAPWHIALPLGACLLQTTNSLVWRTSPRTSKRWFKAHQNSCPHQVPSLSSYLSPRKSALPFSILDNLDYYYYITSSHRATHPRVTHPLGWESWGQGAWANTQSMFCVSGCILRALQILIPSSRQEEAGIIIIFIPFDKWSERFSSLPKGTGFFGRPARTAQSQTLLPPAAAVGIPTPPFAHSAPPQPGLTLPSLALVPRFSVCIWSSAGWVHILCHKTPKRNG